MKLSRIAFLFLLLFLFVPSISSAQSAADKAWQPFWAKFSTAVKKQDLAALKKLVSSDNFQAGGSNETGNEWIKIMEKRNVWKKYQAAVVSGTKTDQCSEPACRITKNKKQPLLFAFINGQWRWTGFASAS